MQSRLMSAVEAVANVAIGYVVSVTANIIVLPLFGLPVSLSQAASIGLVFTGIALVRSYLVRRLFNRLSPRSPKCK
jgi:di/tricarboxylate transporter